MSEIKKVHENIATDRAWQRGRRIYVRCGYHSQLNRQLRDLGAHWDRDERALWIGSTKKNQALELLLSAESRISAIEEVKKAGRWVNIPFNAEKIRDHAKALGAIWDRDRRAWAMPTWESHAEVAELLREHKRKQDEADRKRREEAAEQGRMTEQARKEQAKRDALARREHLIDEADRVDTGETGALRIISTRRMNRPAAEDSAYKVGRLVRLDDGRRGIVTRVKVWFTNSEMASSVCWHDETHDEAHWDLWHEVAIVEPTEDEQTADEAAHAARADAAELRAVMHTAAALDGPTEGWTAIPDERQAGTITEHYGTLQRHLGGRLILTTDGRVIYQHPGYYDDWRRTERTSTDTALVSRVRALLEQGTRTRSVHTQMAYYYEVVSTT